MRLEEIIQMDFEIVVVDGLRIGGSGGDLENGGTVDANLAAIRDPLTGEPYLPGSSIKGKLRSICEKVHGSFRMVEEGQGPQKRVVRRESPDGSPCRCGQLDCKVCPLFGAHLNTRAACAPTRITVRDAHFTEGYKALYQKQLAETGRYFELKTENIVNRKTGTAEHPRTGERVPPGARFQGRIVLRTYDTDASRKDEYVKTIEQALGLLQEAESLGASGSRGFGTIKLEKLCRRARKVAEISVKFQAC
jgi:CRISPR-associated protein Csm3